MNCHAVCSHLLWVKVMTFATAHSASFSVGVQGLGTESLSSLSFSVTVSKRARCVVLSQLDHSRDWSLESCRNHQPHCHLLLVRQFFFVRSQIPTAGMMGPDNRVHCVQFTLTCFICTYQALHIQLQQANSHKHYLLGWPMMSKSLQTCPCCKLHPWH